MRLTLAALLLAGLWAGCHAGSGADLWGIDTLVNYPSGKGRKTVPPQANDVADNSPIEVPCQCSDADPRNEATQLVGVTCFHHRVFGNCNQNYMFDANEELAPEGFCQMSCSRCSCCSPPADVIRSLGGSRFLQAAEAAEPSLKELLAHPGFTATILVPSDDAWDAALGQLGPLAQNPGVLHQLVKFHILPPEPKRNALWTSPFFSLGPKLYTMYDGPATLSTSKFTLPSDVSWRGGLTGFKIQGPQNSATVTKSDVTGCKSYINMIDQVLLPFDPSTQLPSTVLAAATVVGAQGCGITSSAAIRGSTVKAGGSNIQDSVGACCNSCKATGGCNAWSYCAQRGGCSSAQDAQKKAPFGWCELKSSSEIAGGRGAAYDEFDAVKMALVSGYSLAGGNVASAG